MGLKSKLQYRLKRSKRVRGKQDQGAAAQHVALRSPAHGVLIEAAPGVRVEAA